MDESLLRAVSSPPSQPPHPITTQLKAQEIAVNQAKVASDIAMFIMTHSIAFQPQEVQYAGQLLLRYIHTLDNIKPAEPSN